MNIKNVYILEDRAILYINGDDAISFLQNLISNDINKVSETYSCFASLLSPQGKFLYEFIIVKHKSGYLIDCEKSQADELYKQLSVYKLRSKVEILNLSNEFVVAAFSYEKFLAFSEAQDVPGFTLKFREDPILLDPRNKKLGARLIINLEKLYLSLKKLELTDAMNKNDLLEVADALTDILYVTYGAGHAFGIDLDKCFEEVQNSNMSKLDENGKPIYNNVGKVMKGPNYFKPDLSKFVS